MIRLPSLNLGRLLCLSSSILLSTYLTATATEIDPDQLTIEFSDPAKEALTLQRSELLKLEGVRQELVYISYDDTEVPGLALPIKALFDYLDIDDGMSALASSYDGYFSVFEPDFLEQYDPYLLLSMEGQNGDKLQIGSSPDLGPFYITFAKKVKKGSPELMDPDNKKPYGVNWMKVGTYDELLAPLYSGALAELDPQKEYGRQIYINNCMSCHAYENSGLGGTFSNRTTTILGIHAGYNMSYFTQMVKEPSSLIPDVLMSPHPHYTEKEINAVAKFILAANANTKAE